MYIKAFLLTAFMKAHLKHISSNTTQHQTDGLNLCSHTWKLKFELIISTQVLETNKLQMGILNSSKITKKKKMYYKHF